MSSAERETAAHREVVYTLCYCR